MTLYPVTPFLSCRPGYMRNDRHNNSDTEVGVLTFFTGHGPTLPEGSTYHHMLGLSQTAPLFYSQEKRDPAYLSGDFSSMYSWCSLVGVAHNGKNSHMKIS
ncbi:hypothetical protein AVEN_207540-1 [Araneus ventricosus]|uniref:Uncharacterized protein n=1 Tax=Araneus ventricosus TaxID=182803 RepID=A0A4Y2JCX4_ARAVE|nr:hypothetical protein AVEN_207540-1 [Araneus ventricosus]